MSFLSRIFGGFKETALAVVSGKSTPPPTLLEAFSPPLAAIPKDQRSFKQNILPALIDGFVTDAIITHPAGSKLVGEDYNGNRYFEKEDEIYGRHRFVIYKDLWNYHAGSVPPEWHHWLTYIGDKKPDASDPRPFFEIQKMPYDATTPYNPKGSLRNADVRNWKKVQYWQPPQ